ncbi:MAG: hypothetical protein HYT83_01930 [Candidatus Levybacteria bacterium]|nr:hypothetical protein [Candidatus Levybacteria bacterium]
MKTKFSFIFLFAICFFTLSVVEGLFAMNAIALSPTPTDSDAPTPTKTEVKKDTNTSEVINDLKERIASRVAQLKLVKRKGILGTVTDISGTQITLSDPQNNTRFIDVDELTKFSSPSTSAKESFGLSDITKGTKLGILGIYNKQSERILARFVNVISLPTIINAAVTSVNSDDFSFKIVEEEGKSNSVDVEKITKTFSYSKETDLVKSGFSKIKEGQHVMIIGFPDIKDKARIVASRIIIFANIPKNPRIIIPQEALDPQDTTTPSTGSGKKLTPITR